MLSIYKMVALIKQGKFVLVLALNFIAGGLLSMLIDVLLFGAVRHWVFFFDIVGFAIADFFVATGVLFFLLISRIPEVGANVELIADSRERIGYVSKVKLDKN